MNLVKEKQGGLVPRGLKRWPIRLIKHFANTTSVSPSPAGPAGCCPLNFLNLIRVGVIKIVVVINCNLITFSKVIACNCN